MACYRGGMSNGEVLLRLGPDIERLRKAAEAEGISMSQFLREGMEMRMSAGQPGAPAMAAALRLLARTAAQLADDSAPVPRIPPGPSSWDAVIQDGSS
jgi:hypothetical protein